MNTSVENSHTIGSDERRVVWGMAAVIMVITLLPYLVAFGRQGNDWHFTGFLLGVEDGNSYIAKMLTGAAGDWLFRTPYTAYPQDGIILFLPYILLGKLASQPDLHAQLVGLFTIYRLAAGMAAILATYDFVALFIKEGKWRRFATVLAVLGGGFGWLSVIGFQDWFTWGVPLEAYGPEAFGFLSIYSLPHMAAARALLLWALRDFLLRSGAITSITGWVRTAAVWFGLWLFQPITLAVGLFLVGAFTVTSGAWVILRQKRLPQTDHSSWKQYLFYALRIAVIASPLAAYTFLSIRLDPVLQSWETQNYILSPSPLVYLLGYGVALPLALPGIPRLMRHHRWHVILLACWLAFAPFLAYSPLSLQRRLVDGAWVALCILAVSRLLNMHPRLQRPAFAWLLLAFPTTLMLLSAGFFFAQNPSKPLFRPADEVRVFEYLSQAAQPGDVVLAADDSANALPAWTPVRTLIGHGPESINGVVVRERVACFYSDTCPDADRKDLLEAFRVRYVLWGPGERILGSWDPHSASYLDAMYTAGAYILFQTRLP